MLGYYTEAMKYILILFVFLYVAWADVPSQRVGCEYEPCQHKCVDNIESYHCECFENYILQPDQHSCLHKNTEALEKASQGCWSDQEAYRDLPYKIWTRPEDATVSECMHDCNARAFDFAGLQNGDECWCGNTYYRAFDEEAVCDIACPGAPAQLCGGTMTSSIYKVNRDERYMGCFTEDASDPDLPHLLWGETEGNSIDECVTSCGSQGYNYSGVFNGGQCACGNSFGKHGSPGDEFCNVPCYDGYAGFNCGGNTTNAVYRVIKGTDFSQAKQRGILTIEENRAEIPLSQLFLYPNYLGLYMQRFLIYASDTVNTIYDDASCTNGDCYALCGDIYTPPGFDRYSADVVIRQFHIKLSEIESYIAYPEKAQRVYVYAQTFYIDQTVNFPWSLSIRARQIIINYEAEPTLTFDHNGPIIPEDIEEAVIMGLPSDLTFQKLSLLCAQTLLSSTSDDYNRVGWNIIDDMARDRAYNLEQQHFLDNVRAVKASLASIGRNDIHWVPYFSKNHYVETLDEFYQQITIYNEEFEEMLDETMDCQNFKDRASALITIWTDTVIEQAQIIMDYFLDNLAISKATYQGIIVEIQESIVELHEAKDKFIAGIKKAIISALVRGAMNGLVNIIDRMVGGKTPAGAKDVMWDIRESSAGRVIIEGFDYVVEHLTKGNEQMYLFERIKDLILETEDFERYIDNVEIVAQLEKLLPLWNNMTNQTDEVFTEPQFRNIEGALDFAFALYDLLNWGEALTRSLIEHAINLRNFMGVAAMYKTKLEMKLRFEIYFAELQLDCNKQGMMTIRFAEQQYDMMLELNQQLLSFCQAYYYEEMVHCPPDARPNYQYSTQELLTTINQAKLLSMYFSRKSTAKLDIDIVDDSEAWANCTDAMICPITILRDTRTLYYQLPLDHPRFKGLDLFMIEEIEVYLVGATSDDSYTDCRVMISSSGPFYNRRDGGVGTFMSRALSGLMFQYDLNTEQIELYANLHQTGDGSIKHMTPFTTWLITVPSSHDNINLSQVQSVRMVFHGSFFN